MKLDSDGDGNRNKLGITNNIIRLTFIDLLRFHSDKRRLRKEKTIF